MKKLLIILFAVLICTSFTASNYFSWSGLSSNQTVSFANALDAVNTGVFEAKTTISGSNKMMTKAEASTYLYLDESYAPFAAKSSGQLVVKSDLVYSNVYTHGIYGSTGAGPPVNTVCGYFTTIQIGNLYSYRSAGSSPVDGIILYQINTGGVLSVPVGGPYSGWNGIQWLGTTKIICHTDASSAMLGVYICP